MQAGQGQQFAFHSLAADLSRLVVHRGGDHRYPGRLAGEPDQIPGVVPEPE